MKYYRLTIEPVIFLYQTVTFLYYFVVPQLVLKKFCLRKHHFNETLCNDEDSLSPDVHQSATQWWFYIIIFFQIPAIFIVLISGPISDIVGRYNPLVCFPLIDILAGTVFLLNAYFIEAHPVLLMAGFLLTSFFGGLQGVAYLCFSFVADLEEKNERRTLGLALVEATLQSSGVVAGLLGGYILSTFGFLHVFLLPILMDVIIFCYVFCYLSKYKRKKPITDDVLYRKERTADKMKDEGADSIKSESKSIGGNNNSSGRTYLTLETYFEQLAALFIIISKNKVIIITLIIYMLLMLAAFGEHIIQTLYLKNKPFQFTPNQIGYYGAVQSSSRGLGILLISLFSYYVINISDCVLIIISSFSGIVSFTFIGFVRSPLTVYVGTTFSLALPVGFVAIRSLVTKHIPPDKFGAVFALLGSITVTMILCVNVVFIWTYDVISIYSGGVYFCLGSVACLAMTIGVILYLAT